MKGKLIACILGLSIILSTETTILAEGEDPSAGSAVQETVTPQPDPGTAPPVDTTGNTGAAPADTGTASSDTGTAPVDTGTSGEGGVVTDPSVNETPQENGEGTGSDVTDPAVADSTAVSGGSVAAPGLEEAVSAAESTSVPGNETGSENTGSEEGTSSSSVSEEAEEDKSKEDDEKDKEKKEILVVGFSGIADITVGKKPALKEAAALFPTVIEGVLSDGNKIRVPVDWGCVSDYEDKKADRFTFASSLKKNGDGSVYDIGYPIAPGVRFPTASIVIKKPEDEKEKGREPEKKIEEDTPLVMDDVTAANISPDEGEEKVFVYLMRELGLNRAAACGVLANIHYESGFNPHAVGDGGTSYGICQWHAGRYLTLVSYCSNIKLPYGSVEGQLKYLEEELSGGYAHVLDYLKKVPDTAVGAFDAAYYWCYHFERPAMILRQSTLRGNAAKNSYWPRYKDADPDKMDGNENSIAAEKKMDLLVRKLESDVDTEDEIPKQEADPVSENSNSKQDTEPVPVKEDEVKETAEEKQHEYETLEAVTVQTVAEYRTLLAEQKKFQAKALTEDELFVDMESPVFSETEQTEDEKSDDLVFFTAFVKDEAVTDESDDTKVQDLYFTFDH